MKLKDQVLADFEKKAPLIFEHLWRCMELGVPTSVLRIRWDKKKEELMVEVSGSIAKASYLGRAGHG